MHRRQFLAAGLAAGGALQVARNNPVDAQPFRLSYAPHFGQFARIAGEDLYAQLEWASEHGFTAFEDNEMAGRSDQEIERIARTMQRLGMRMGVFVANFGTAFGKRSFSTAAQEHVQSFLADLERAIEVAKRTNAKWMTVVLGDAAPGLAHEIQMANAIEMLRRGAELLEPHELVMVMEPLNFRDHPGMLLQRIPQSYLLCKAVASPAVKILFDLYHQQITEGNLIPNIDAAWDEIAYFQIGDNPGRKEPGTGEINYGQVFKHIHERGFEGILGMEHGNSRSGAEGDLAVLEAYRGADACIAR